MRPAGRCDGASLSVQTFTVGARTLFSRCDWCDEAAAVLIPWLPLQAEVVKQQSATAAAA
jgi:hypothetical protein